MLLLDEPTNHLDLDTVIWLENWLRAYQGTLLLISHDRDFLDAVAEHIIHFDNRRATLYTGNYSAFERLRAERLALQQSQYRKQQREIAHMRSFVDRFRAKASKARQAQSRIKALERMEMIAPAHVDSPFHFSLRPPEKLPNPLLRIDDASAGYGGAPVLQGVRLTLTPGDRIGLLGANGAGKSTLIKLVAGMLKPSKGERVAANDLKIGYFAQHQVEQLDPERSPLEHFFEIEPTAREMDLRNYLGGFGFSSDTVFMNTGPFSGGEKSRLALALLVYRRPNLLLLDEPTNHLDLEMRQALSVALQEFPGAMMIVSHDRRFLSGLVNRVWEVDSGSFREYEGDWSFYLRKRRERAAADAERASALKRSEPEVDTPDRAVSGGRFAGRSPYQLRKHLDGLEDRIRTVEAELDTVGASLSRPEVEHEEIAGLGERHAALEAERVAMGCTPKPEFDNRVLFQMSANDSSNLIDSPAASRLGANRAVFFSEESGVAEKFRPYAPMEPGEARAALDDFGAGFVEFFVGDAAAFAGVVFDEDGVAVEAELADAILATGVPPRVTSTSSPASTSWSSRENWVLASWTPTVCDAMTPDYVG